MSIFARGMVGCTQYLHRRLHFSVREMRRYVCCRPNRSVSVSGDAAAVGGDGGNNDDGGADNEQREHCKNRSTTSTAPITTHTEKSTIKVN